jgi:hypothetical protein
MPFCKGSGFIQRRVILLYLFCETPDRLNVSNIQNRGLHPGIRPYSLLQQLFTPPGNDDLVSLRMKRLRQSPPDPSAAARNQNRIPADLHDFFSSPQ